MAMIAIPIAGDISGLFKGKDLSREIIREPADHITLFYLGKDIGMEETSEIIPTIYDITKGTADRVTTFFEDYDDTHSDYLPHITLGYSGKKVKGEGLPRFTFMINENRTYTNFSFSFGIKLISDKYYKRSQR